MAIGVRGPFIVSTHLQLRTSMGSSSSAFSCRSSSVKDEASGANHEALRAGSRRILLLPR